MTIYAELKDRDNLICAESGIAGREMEITKVFSGPPRNFAMP